jgi:DNA-binding NarL/FixJ family response regulator
MIRVLIADDHPVVREGLKLIVAETTDMVVAAEAEDGQEVVDLLESVECDVVVLDISMPRKSGVEAFHEIHPRYPDLPVLILSVHPETQYALHLLRAGVAGYLTKDRAPRDLVAAIRRVAYGGRYITPALADRLAFSIEKGGKTLPHELLSPRELQVLGKIATGMQIKDIAEELGLSVKTISTYRARILAKLNLQNTAELIRYAFEHLAMP